jgi:hypothetical protein
MMRQALMENHMGPFNFSVDLRMVAEGVYLLHP